MDIEVDVLVLTTDLPDEAEGAIFPLGKDDHIFVIDSVPLFVQGCKDIFPRDSQLLKMLFYVMHIPI